jgi:soluble lytic murein transglycosylase-like protein
MNSIALYFLLASAQYHIPANLLSSLCYVESTHKIDAIHYNDGKGNSVGICQIKLKSAKQMGFGGTEKQLMNPKTNIYYAAKFLNYQIKRYHSVQRGVIAYNKGNARSLTTSEYQVKVYKKWRNNEGQRSISSNN